MRNTIFIILSVLMSSVALLAQDLYDINNVTIIELTFDNENWDQTMDEHYANDMDERLLASCTVNGIQFDSVGVKYKGNSTYNANNPKNPLNIKLNHIIGNQDYDGWYTLKLSNGDKDPSFIREALSYEILRKYMVAPRSNFAKVFINGSYYGLFTSNESINKKFIDDYLYSDNENTLIKCNPEIVMNGGSSLEYLDIDSLSYFDSYEVKSDYGWNDLVDFTDNLNNSFSNSETFLNIDRAIWMLAFNNVFVNLDSYTGPFKQNYYLYQDDHSKMNTIVWDLNMSLGGFRLINLGGPGGPGGPTTVQDLQQMDPLLRLGDNTYPLVNNILSNERYKKMYIAHCRTMLEENFANDLYFERGDAMQTLIYDDYDSDPSQFFSTTNFTSNLTSTISGAGGPGNGPYVGITELMDARTTFLFSHAEFQEAPPMITPPSTDVVSPNSVVDFRVEISNANYAYLGYRNSRIDPFTKIELFDDGAHNDGTAGDGTFGASIDVGASSLQYYIYADNNDAGIFSPQRAEHEYHELVVAGDIVINEILTSNSFIQMDEEGEFDDWIELYNNTSSDVDVSGYYLSDDVDNTLKWSFPNETIIDGNSYLIVWADKDTMQTGLHANFKLSSSGETLFLSDESGNLVDELIFSNQMPDVSFGRYPNGTGVFTSMPSTYNSENSLDPQITSIGELNALKDFLIFPNPALDYFTVNFDLDSSPLLEVYNSLGVKVYNEVVVNGSVINISGWPKGIYFLKIDGNSSEALVKY